MKKTLSLLLQFALLVFVCVAGSFVRPFHLQRTLESTQAVTRIFVWDGFVLMLLVWVLIAVIEGLRKRLRSGLPVTTVALVLATVVSLALKVGFITRD